MDILDKAFHTYLGQLGWRALADLIADKAAAQGIQLTPREKAALARRLAKTDATEEVTFTSVRTPRTVTSRSPSHPMNPQS